MSSRPFPEDARWRGGRGPLRFSYTYQDFARLYGVTPETIRNWVSAGKLDPEDLRSVVALLKQRQEEKDGHDKIRRALALPKEATRDHLIEAMWTRLKGAPRRVIHAPSNPGNRQQAKDGR